MNKQAILSKLNLAESALQSNLHRHDLDPTARDHMQRAISHVCEAYVAINECGRARTIDQLLEDLRQADQIIQRVRKLRI